MAGPVSRLFKGYASAYSARQVQPLRVRRFQVRHLVADFNGSIPKDSVIESVVWECTSPWATYISDASIAADQKSAAVKVTFNFAGWGAIKATVTVDDGSVEDYEFYYTVQDSPLYPSATYNTANGPYSLTVTA